MRRGKIFKTAAARQGAVTFFRKLAAERQVIAKAGHVSNNNTKGGFLVADELAATIESIAERYGIFLSDARRYGMKGDQLLIPRRSGAASFNFTAEAETAAESELNYGMVNHLAKKVLGFIPISNELLEDADNAADDITLAFGQGYALITDTVGFNGTGVANDGGMTGIATLLADGTHAGGVEAATGHDTFLEIDIPDLTKLVATLPARAAPDAAWYCSHFGAAKSFYRLAAGAGGIGRNSDGEPTFWNWPIRQSPTLPAVDTTLAGKAMILFGDLRQSSSLGLRRDLEIGASALGLSWSFDVTKFRARARFSLLHTDIGSATTPGAVVALLGKA